MSENDSVIAAKLDAITNRMTPIEASLSRLADAMVSIARLEVSMAGSREATSRAFDSIDKISNQLSQHSIKMDDRIKRLEEVAPINKLISGWVLAWIAGLVGLVGGAVASKVMGL